MRDESHSRFPRLWLLLLLRLCLADGVKLETSPNPIPDLYSGEPVVLTAVTGSQSGKVNLTGRIGSKPWSTTLDLSTAVEGSGVSKLWARSKITGIESLRYKGGNEGDILGFDLVIGHACRRDQHAALVPA